MKQEIGAEVVKLNEWCRAPSDIYPEITGEGERSKAVSSQDIPEVCACTVLYEEGARGGCQKSLEIPDATVDYGMVVLTSFETVLSAPSLLNAVTTKK